MVLLPLSSLVLTVQATENFSSRSVNSQNVVLQLSDYAVQIIKNRQKKGIPIPQTENDLASIIDYSYCELAISLYKNGYHDKAKQLLNDELKFINDNFNGKSQKKEKENLSGVIAKTFIIIEDFDRGIAILSSISSASIRYNTLKFLGLYYAVNGKLDQALNVTKELQGKYKSNIPLYYSLSAQFYKKINIKLSNKYLNNALELINKKPVLKNPLLISNLFVGGFNKQASNLLNKAFNELKSLKSPNNSKVLEYIQWAVLGYGNKEQIKTFLNIQQNILKQLSLNKTNNQNNNHLKSTLKTNVAQLQYMSENKKAACDSIEKMDKKQSDHALSMLANIYVIGRNNISEALKIVHKTRNPKLVSEIYNSASIFAISDNNFEDAMNLIPKIDKKDRTDAVVFMLTKAMSKSVPLSAKNIVLNCLKQNKF